MNNCKSNIKVILSVIHVFLFANVSAQNIDVFNIERTPVQAYNTVIYDDTDYSYSKINNYYRLIKPPISYLPNVKVLENPCLGKNDVLLKLYSNSNETDKFLEREFDSTNETINIDNLYPNCLYRYELWNSKNSEMIERGIFITEGKTRMLRVPAVCYADTIKYNQGLGVIYNVRDLGGLKTEEGKSIKYGKIIRGSALMRSDGFCYLSDEGINELKYLGISAELDLRRTSLKASALGDDVDYVSVPIDQWFYRLNIFHNLQKQVQAFSSAIRYILNLLRKGGCVYVHCAGGADRTGALCTIIEGLCGVTENELCHDYEITSFYSNRRRDREYYQLEKGSKYNGDYKFAISYIKGLLEYDGKIYVKQDGHYYDTNLPVSKYTPTPITDSTLIRALDSQPPISLKERFRLLMQIGGQGLSIQEMDELETVLLKSRYKLTYVINDEVFHTDSYEYGSPISAPNVPESEGKHFSGWIGLPETMPTHDIIVTGTFDTTMIPLIIQKDNKNNKTFWTLSGYCLKDIRYRSGIYIVDGRKFLIR